MSQLFSRKALTQKLLRLHERGAQQKSRYWDFGFPLFTEQFPGLRSGLVFIFAPENVGKSTLQLNLAIRALQADPEVVWLDFSLDDSEEDRLGYLLACAGELPINLIKQCAEASEADQERRTAAFSRWRKEYGERHMILAVSDDSDEEEETLDPEDLFRADRIAATIQEARNEIGPDRKLLVTIDGFHDIQLNEYAADENARQRRKGEILKTCASQARALILLTAHQIKHTRSRNVTTDDMYGAAAAKYHAKVVIHVYCELNEIGTQSPMVWTDALDPDKTYLPLLEGKTLKNKGGHLKNRLFFNYIPRRAYLRECSKPEQDEYLSYIH